MDNAEAPSNAIVLEFKEDTALTEVSALLHNFSFFFNRFVFFLTNMTQNEKYGIFFTAVSIAFFLDRNLYDLLNYI